MDQITILTGYAGKCIYRDISLRNIEEYCERWGHHLVAHYENEIDISNKYWYKHDVIRQNCRDGSVNMWIDADCIFTNMAKPLPSLDGNDMLLTLDGDLQAGCFMFKAWSDILYQWWSFNPDYEADNDNSCLTQLVRARPELMDNIKVLSNKEFVTKHIHFEKGDFIMHVPGSSEEEKKYYMELYSKEIVR